MALRLLCLLAADPKSNIANPHSLHPRLPQTRRSVRLAVLVLCGVRVILAAFYGVPTFRFNEAVKRNADRFPEDDFRFQLTREEAAHLITET